MDQLDARAFRSILDAQQPAGDQTIEVATVPALIQQCYGIEGDERDLMKLLDEEAPLIAAEEEEQADNAFESSVDDEELDEEQWEDEQLESPGEDEQEEADEK